jgi:hypothetical protein
MFKTQEPVKLTGRFNRLREYKDLDLEIRAAFLIRERPEYVDLQELNINIAIPFGCDLMSRRKLEDNNDTELKAMLMEYINAGLNELEAKFLRLPGVIDLVPKAEDKN